MTLAPTAPYDNAIASFFTFMQSLSIDFQNMITQRLAVNKSSQEQRALDRRIRKVQHEVKKDINPRLDVEYNAEMVANEVKIEFSQPGDTAEMRTLIINQFNWELLQIPIPNPVTTPAPNEAK